MKLEEVQGYIRCDEVFGKKQFDTHSEFYLALCMASECGRLGMVFDMSHMHIDPDSVQEQKILYFKYLISKGAIHIDGKEKVKDSYDKCTLVMDSSYITDLEDVLVENRGDSYFWSYDYAFNSYTVHRSQILNLQITGNLIMHIVAHMLIGFIVGKREKKPIYIKFDKMHSRNEYMYIDLFSCAMTLDWFKELVNVDLELTNFIDIGYIIHCENAKEQKRNLFWSAPEKIGFMKKLGMVEGSILVLWSRRGVCKNSPIGKITSSIIIRVDEICSDSIAVTTMPLNKTKEEVYDDYLAIPKDKRYLFSDLLSQKPAVSSKLLSIYELGIDNYFKDESQFITKIDKNERVTKKITINGESGNVEMSGVDAIYWLMCQYNLDFNRELYRNMYNNGNPLLWDEYGKQ